MYVCVIINYVACISKLSRLSAAAGGHVIVVRAELCSTVILRNFFFSLSLDLPPPRRFLFNGPLLTRSRKSSRPYNPVSIIFDYSGCARLDIKSGQRTMGPLFYVYIYIRGIQSRACIYKLGRQRRREKKLWREVQHNVHKSIRSRAATGSG